MAPKHAATQLKARTAKSTLPDMTRWVLPAGFLTESICFNIWFVEIFVLVFAAVCLPFLPMFVG